MLFLQRGKLNSFGYVAPAFTMVHTAQAKLLFCSSWHITFMHLHFTMHGLCPAQTVLHQVLLECSIRWCDGSGAGRETTGAAKGILESGQA